MASASSLFSYWTTNQASPSRFAKRFRVPTCVPTLYDEAENHETPKFKSTCAMVLLCLSLDESLANLRPLNEEECTGLLDKVERNGRYFASLPGARSGVDGMLTLDELLVFCEFEKNREFIRSLPCTLHGLLVEELVREAFTSFDADDSESLDMEEWTLFLVELNDMYILYKLRLALTEYRAFFGRGISEERIKATAGNYDHEVHRLKFQFGRDPDCEDELGRRLIPAGWFADLVYYSANVHPLHSIFCHDPASLLHGSDRILIEFSTWCFSFWNLIVVENQLHSSGVLANPKVFSLVTCVIPSMVVANLLLYLFSCPHLGHVNMALSSLSEVKKAARWKVGGLVVGYVLVLLGLCVLVMGVHSGHYQQFGKLFIAVLLTRLQAYVLAWLLMVVLTFNPVVAWGESDPKLPSGFAIYVGLGQWRIEKQLFRTRLADVMDLQAEAERKAAITAQASKNLAKAKERGSDWWGRRASLQGNISARELVAEDTLAELGGRLGGSAKQLPEHMKRYCRICDM